MKEITDHGDIILFIDEIHNLVGAGAAEGAIDAASILKPALARGEIQVIGATTIDEYRKYVEKDKALERRFQTIQVGEPSVEETELILKGLREKYEEHHKIEITDEALKAASQLGDRYISDRFLPDKAIDLVDEAASKMRIKTMSSPPYYKEIDEELAAVRSEKEAAIDGQEFEKAARFRDSERKLVAQRRELEKAWREGKIEEKRVSIGEDEIAEIVSMWTGIPVKKMTEEESARLLQMEDALHGRIVGQNEAIKAVSRSIRRTFAGIKDPNRPSGSFVFLGPTGVGKTELRKIFRPELLNRIDEIIVFHKLEPEDMRHIIEIQIKRLRHHLVERDVTIEFTNEALDKLAEDGYDPAFGARPLRRVLQRMIEDPMSEMILRGDIPNGSKVIIEPNEKSSEDINEEESIVDIKVTQPKEIVKVESE